MSKIDTTVLKDGQLAVATFEQSGTLISGASAIDATCLVQTEDGVQQCVKTFPLGEGGGGGGGGGGGADTSLSNLTAAGKEVVANLSMPGETRIDLSVVGPTVLITAIADGYMQFYFNTSLNSGQVHVLRSIDTQLDSNAVSLINSTICRTDPRGPRITVPIAKGEKALYETSDNSWVTAIRFVYAKGSEPQQ